MRAPNSYDVAIVGSGPAGSAAALALARAGSNVAIIEKERLPRYKTCGGGVLRRAAALLPIDITAAVERDCYQAELNLLDAQLNFATRRAAPIIRLTMRDRFDQLLASAAQEAGATLLTETTVRDLTIDADRLTLETSRQTIRANFVIAADGANSLIAGKAGWSAAPALIPALEWEVTVAESIQQQFAAAARFDFGVIDYGYGWVFPKQQHLSIGILTRRRGINLIARLREYLKLIGITEMISCQQHGALIPIAPRAGRLARDRVLLTGDVAGLADPITAEGITFAIRSGQLAAQALIEQNCRAGQVERAYQAALNREILPELRLARWLARLLYDYPRLRGRLFRRYGQRLCEAVTDLIAGQLSYREILTNPKNYLKLFNF